MNTPSISLEKMAEVYRTEHDWLFEKLLGKLEANRPLILTADQGWGMMEYVRELGFQLSENNPDIHVCYLDMKPAHSTTAFLQLFAAAFSYRFPEAMSRMEVDTSSINCLKLPSLIARREKIRVAVFLGNAHLLHRFRNQITFLRTFRIILKNQKNSIFCLHGKNNHYFRDLVIHPGILTGLGQVFHLRHDPSNHRSAFIRKLFNDHQKKIEYATSVQMSFMVDNHPFYLKLLAWHALIRTKHTCTEAIVETAMNELIYHFDNHFYKVAESLTPKQLHYLHAILDGTRKLCSGAILERYGLGSSSHIARIRESLQKKELITTGRRRNTISDPIFREWLRKHYHAGV